MVECQLVPTAGEHLSCKRPQAPSRAQLRSTWRGGDGERVPGAGQVGADGAAGRGV
jgi:hypothetical protein